MICFACGASSPDWAKSEPVDDVLANTWEISKGLKQLFNIREGSLCQNCGINIRAEGLAKGISAYYGIQSNFQDWVERANKSKLKVAEINSCHKLHTQMAKVKGLTFSDYVIGDHSEDIQNLSYKDNSFDLVIHSETLEHVPNPIKALDECRRILKKNGAVIFTIPIVWSKNNRQRADRNKKITNLLPPSYHGLMQDDYLVYWEFGRDFINQAGCKIVWHDASVQNYVFIAGKEKSTTRPYEIMKFRLMEKLFELKYS